MSVKSTTTNLGLSKFSRGISVRDTDLAANMDLIDVAIGTIQALVDGNADGAVAKVVAESNVIGGLPLTFMIPIAAGALGNTDVVMAHKVRILDAYLILRGVGVATTTLQIFNGTDAITDAMAASGSDTDIVRAATIDDAHYEIDAAGTLRVTSATGATQPDALVVVTAVRVA
jgi:hypothetical protein